MTNHLAVLAGVFALSCASSKAERREVPTTAVPSASMPQASAPSSSSGAREQANADLASAQARLQEAQREAERARADWAAADAEAKSAQRQMDAAKRGADSVAEARAAEIAQAAEAHQRSATTHLDYANKLVAARRADIEVAQSHARTVEAGGGAAVSTSGTSQQPDPKLVAAQDAENAARSRAAELGRAALAAQRAWEDAAGAARAGSPTDATTSGTGLGGATDHGAAIPAPSSPPPAR